MRYVIAIAENGGFQLAAERLHMAQPPLSRQIRELERELFHRRPTRLTAEGHVFVEHARVVLADVERAVAETRAAGGAASGVVRVGCGPMSGSTDVPSLVAAVAARHPGITVEVSELWDSALVSALISGDVAVGIGWHLSVGGSLARQVLRSEPYVIVVADEHRLACKDAVDLGELSGDTFRFLPRRFAPDYYEAVLRAVHSTGAEFSVWENPLPGLRYFGDLRSGGFNVLPASMATSLPAGLTCLRMLDDVPPATLVMLWKPGTGRAVEAVAETARALGGARIC